MTKRLIAIIVIVLLVATVFVGCGKAATGDTKMGFGSVTTIAKSANAKADADGKVQSYTELACVVIDKDGKIVNVWIDSIQANVAFDATGAIKTDLATKVQTKRELGDAYGMKAKSALGKEWYEQADSLEKYLIGKTKADVQAIKLTEGKAADSDLSSTVSVTVENYLAAVVEAIDNAQ